MPILTTWHAYVGYELDLFTTFKKPISLQTAADQRNLSQDLLARWVDVGLAVGHLKEKQQLIQVKNYNKMPVKKTKTNMSGILLKEMMELHIPTLLSYPELMRQKSKQEFNADKHGEIVAETSSLLEGLALKKLYKVVKKRNSQSVLDIGCGHGGYLSKLAEKFPELSLTGIDINETVIEEAKHRNANQNIRFMNENVMSMPQTEERFDIVMMNNVFHYIAPSQRQKLFEKAAQLLSPNGQLFIVTPIKNPKHGKPFSSAFNSFFTAFENLYPLPSAKEIHQFSKTAHTKPVNSTSIVREGGWYVFILENKRKEVAMLKPITTQTRVPVK
ncbi:class I SAM-dependent methyltransferase [Aureibacillus halotolerans]|nr:class I SAM-dependent methyltransferase [Aureibacillus halotolerans]